MDSQRGTPLAGVGRLGGVVTTVSGVDAGVDRTDGLGGGAGYRDNGRHFQARANPARREPFSPTNLSVMRAIVNNCAPL